MARKRRERQKRDQGVAGHNMRDREKITPSFPVLVLLSISGLDEAEERIAVKKKDKNTG